MERLNQYWAVLRQGHAPATPYSRNYHKEAYRRNERYDKVMATLVPSLEGVDSLFQIEQLVQQVLLTPLKDRLLDLDVLNTYQKSMLSFPEPGFDDTWPGDLFFFDDQSDDRYFDFECELDTTTNTFTTPMGSAAYSVSNNLTSHLILVPGKTIRLKGPFTAPLYVFRVVFQPKLSVNWPQLIQQLETLDLPWEDADLRRIWKDDFSWVNRLAAVTVSTVEANVVQTI